MISMQHYPSPTTTTSSGAPVARAHHVGGDGAPAERLCVLHEAPDGGRERRGAPLGHAAGVLRAGECWHRGEEVLV